MKNKIISFLFAICLVAGMTAVPIRSYAEEFDWNSKYVDNDAYLMTFRPSDKYVSTQNPPSFNWPISIDAEKYEFIICSDESLTDVKYRYNDILINTFTPPEVLETGVNYYWSVRYYLNGRASKWSEPLRFRIDPDAHEYLPGNIDDIMARIPKSHPRVFTRPEKLDELRRLKDTNKYAKIAYETYLEKAKRYMQERNLYDDPTSVHTESSRHTQLNSAVSAMTDQIMACGFVYLVSGDKEIGEYGVEALLKLTSWDPHGLTSAENATQANRAAAIYCAQAYDWLYDLLSESERKQVLTMLKERTDPISTRPSYLRTNLYYESHGWTQYMYAGIVAYATYGEIEGYEKVLRDTIETFSMVPAWSYEDGAWGQGNHYYLGRYYDKDFIDLLALSGVVNFYDKAWYQNEYLYLIYAWPVGSYGSFGQGAGLSTPEEKDFTATDGMRRSAFFNNNGYAKYFVDNARGMSKIERHNYYYTSQASEVEAISPVNLPLAHHFKDVGLVNMTNDHVDRNRIQMSFISSFYGTYNHSSNHNNGIVISAFGENLLIHSGFYDSYMSIHDKNVYRASSSNNTITTANSEGQRTNSIEAKGRITNFVNHPDFDLASGDASDAYMHIKKFERSVVYIRPDMFVIIDDLKLSDVESKTAKYEWWLNALSEISVYENGNGARLQEGNAVLDASVKYPKNIKTYYNDMWANSNMIESPPAAGYADKEPHKRVWFETEKLNETKMIVTLDVHQNKVEARNVDTEYFENYIKMTFEDGTIMYVNLGKREETVDTGDIVFTGDAVVYNDESIMLVSGTSLIYSGTELIKSEETASVCIGKDEIGISVDDDNRISVHTNNDYIDEVSGITDYNGREVSSAIGISYESGILKETEAKTDAKAGDKDSETEVKKAYIIEEADDYITFTADKDSYSLMLNGKRFVSEEMKGELSVTVGGEEKIYELNGYSRRDGSGNYSAKIELPAKKYRVIDKNIELDFGGTEKDGTRTFSTVNVSSQVDKNYIVLEVIEPIKLNSTFEPDYDSIKNKAAVVVEAEGYEGSLAEGALVYSTRQFLSGGKGVQLFNTQGSQMRYTFEIKEAGVYDFAVKYVSWTETNSDKGTTIRAFNINGKDYEFSLERKTNGFGSTPEQWHTAITDSGLELEPGKYEIILEAVSGLWNYDWFALIKR